jgi:stage II sporulation protein E
MNVNEKMKSIKRAVKFSADEATSARMKHAALAGLNFLIAFLMSAVRMAGFAAPFGVAAVAQAGSGLSGVCALAGAALGYLATGGMSWGLKYAAASVLVFTVCFVLQDLRITARTWFMPLCAALAMLFTGFLGSFSSGLAAGEAVIHICIEAVLAAGAAYFFREALSAGERNTESAELRHEAAVAVFIACALAAVTHVEIMGVISLGRLGALLVVLTAALKGGVTAGAAAGTVFGIIMDACSGGVPFYTMAYAFSGMLAGFFGKHGRLPFLMIFILANACAVACAWKWAAQLNALFEGFAASVIFMMVPPTVMARFGSALQPVSAGVGESGLRRYAARRVEGVAAAYSDLCDVVRRAAAPANDNDVAKIFDRAADVSCIKCKKKNDCWNKITSTRWTR